jgi:regulator of sigma E protease
MNILDFTWYYIIVFLIVLSILIFVHEWGHYWVAKRAGVRIETFSIGFGPEIVGWTDAANTHWKISAIPLGGYVKMFGMDANDVKENGNTQEILEEDKKVSFQYKTLGQRSAIVAAGPVVNFIFAIIVFAGLAIFQGTANPMAVVGKIFPGSAAEDAGLKPGDQILGIDDQEIVLFEELRDIILQRGGVTVNLTLLRDGVKLNMPATPKTVTDNSDKTIDIVNRPKIGLLGIRPHLDYFQYKQHDPFTAIWIGIQKTAGVSWDILEYVGDLISGDRGTDDLGGPLRIAQISGEMAQGGVSQLIFLMAMLSVNLGLINLFPIPMLDGGHLAFYLAEALRGRPLGPKVQEYGFRFGLVLVLSLVIFVTWNDLVHLRVIEFIANLFT